jgi:hypothetical protein
VPGYGLFVIRLTGYLTGLLEGVRKVKGGPGDVNLTTAVSMIILARVRLVCVG